MTEEETKHLYYRVKMVPSQLLRAREKHRALVREAASLQMLDLLTDSEMAILADREL